MNKKRSESYAETMKRYDREESAIRMAICVLVLSSAFYAFGMLSAVRGTVGAQAPSATPHPDSRGMIFKTPGPILQ